MLKTVNRETTGEKTTNAPAAPMTGSLHRASRLSFRAAFALALSAAALMKAADDVAPVEQPLATSQLNAGFVSVTDRSLPSPDEPLEMIMQKLEDPAMVEQFLKLHVTGQDVWFPIGFAGTYRRDPEDFLREKQGPCSNSANFAGYWGAMNGKKSYTVSIRPRNPLYVPFSSWHQFQVFCIRRNERYLIFDNGKRHYTTSIPEFLKKNYPDMTMVGTGGSVPWKRTSNTVLGALSIHAQENVAEGDMEENTDLDGIGRSEPFAMVRQSIFSHLEEKK